MALEVCRQQVKAVVTSVNSGQAEVHQLDQFFRIEEGSGEAILDGVRSPVSAGFAVLVPAGAQHNIINTSSEPLRLYTLHAPPNHRDGVVHHTRADAVADREHFDGKTSEWTPARCNRRSGRASRANAALVECNWNLCLTGSLTMSLPTALRAELWTL